MLTETIQRQGKSWSCLNVWRVFQSEAVLQLLLVTHAHFVQDHVTAIDPLPDSPDFTRTSEVLSKYKYAGGNSHSNR